VDQLRKFLPGIMDVERINRVTLGVHFEGVGPARITKVDADSPAEAAGLKVGDMVVAVDGQAIAQDIDFFVEMMEKKSGEDVTLTVLREGKRHKFVVRLGERPSGTEQAWRKLGMRLRPISAEQAGRLGLSPGAGLVIYEVHEAGPAHEAGIEPGDILVQVGRAAAKDLQNVADTLDSVKTGERIDVTILRIQQGRMATRMQQFTVALKAK
jgi:serine protease Do